MKVIKLLNTDLREFCKTSNMFANYDEIMIVIPVCEHLFYSEKIIKRALNRVNEGRTTVFNEPQRLSRINLKFYGIFGTSYFNLYHFICLEKCYKDIKYSMNKLHFQNNQFNRLGWQESTQLMIDFMDKETDNFNIDAPEVKNCLDAGAGNKQRHSKIIPVDKRNNLNNNNKNTFIQSDLNKENCLSAINKIDRVYACHSIEHLDKCGLENFLSEVWRILPIGGKLNAIVPHSMSLGAYYFDHSAGWDDLTLEAVCGKIKIYTNAFPNFHFKLANRLLWAERSDRLHYHFIIEKISKQEEMEYLDKGKYCYQDSKFENMETEKFINLIIKDVIGKIIERKESNNGR